MFSNFTAFAGGTNASGSFLASLLAFVFGVEFVFEGFVFVSAFSFAGVGVFATTGRSLRAAIQGLSKKK